MLKISEFLSLGEFLIICVLTTIAFWGIIGGIGSMGLDRGWVRVTNREDAKGAKEEDERGYSY